MWVRFGVGVVVRACVCVCVCAGVALGTGVGSSRRGRVCGREVPSFSFQFSVFFSVQKLRVVFC